MDALLDFIKAIVFGIVEGITEWLPVSSTGHMIILEEFFSLKETQGSAFFEFFLVIIQLAAIMAVIINFFSDLCPFCKNKTAEQKKAIWRKWGNILIASIPAAVFGILFDDWLDAHLHNYVTVASTLIIYGLAFIAIEAVLVGKKKKAQRRYHLDSVSSTIDEGKDPYGIFRTHHVEHITIQQAMIIGLAQCLALIPGTSRSGVTICAALLLSIDRTTGTEFSFYLSIPAMVGGSLIKTASFVRHGNTLSGMQFGILAVACIVSFVVSFLVIRFLLRFLRTRTFISFGVYRVVFGCFLLILYFSLIRTGNGAEALASTNDFLINAYQPSMLSGVKLTLPSINNPLRIAL